MKYEYQILEGDSPIIPPEMLNEQGDDGWNLCAVVVRSTRPPEPANENRWVFYFSREKKKLNEVANPNG